MSAESDEDADVEEAMPIGGSPTRPAMTGDRLFEMDAIGWIMFVLLLVILIPLLPILLVIVVLQRLFGWGSDRRISWT